MFCKLGVASRNQWQFHGARIGHVGCGVEPVLEKEKQAEDKAGGLAPREEIDGEKKWDQPLEQRASPKAERGAEPSKQVVAAFVHDEVGHVDEEKSAMRGKGITEERHIEHEPRGQHQARDRLPWLVEPKVLSNFIEKGQQVFAHRCRRF